MLLACIDDDLMVSVSKEKEGEKSGGRRVFERERVCV